jgi:transcription initiation factor TFIID TATA-box-binding protein
MTRVRIENVVASTSLGDAFDLPAIALALDGAEYEPAQFPGLIYRMTEPRTAILLFHSGKVVCTGGKSWRQVDDSIRTISALLRKAGHHVIKNPRIQVQNIVATSDLGGGINLNLIAVTLGLDRVEYEPEQFPGLVCRMHEPRVVILLFGSGKLVCTGARRPSDLSLAVENITKELRDADLLGAVRAPAEPLRHRPPGGVRSVDPAVNKPVAVSPALA